jgi:flagellar biogenesis protein FliO
LTVTRPHAHNQPERGGVTVSEHGLLVLMLGFTMFETFALTGLLGYFVYRLDRKSGHIEEKSEQIEGMIAATYLAARRALRQPR